MKALLLLLIPGLAYADDPCEFTVADPVITPVRDVALDAQRAACVRDDVAVGMLAHALIDTPGFHGVLGGDLLVGVRFSIKKAYELSAQLRVVDVTYVQNAVNKATHIGGGPVVLGGVATTPLGAARAGVLLQLELPFTRDRMDTMHFGGQLAAIISDRLTDRLVLHGRLGGVGMVASSLGGDTSRVAFRAGADLAWHLRERLALSAGAEISAGWYGGFDHVLFRAGLHWQPTDRWRLLAGLGAPAFGDERTNAVIVVTVAHDS